MFRIRGSWFVFLFTCCFVVPGSLFPIGGQDLRFEVASVKPNSGADLNLYFDDTPDGLKRTNIGPDALVRSAFDLQDFRVLGLPDWTHRERYDIVARAGRPITPDERSAMLRTLLVERFGLRAHMEQRQQTVHIMTTARADKQLGPGIKRSPECETSECPAGGSVFPSGLRIRGLTLQQFAAGALSGRLDQLVEDQTGVAGRFDFEMTFRPDGVDDPGDGRPSFTTALTEQLGLKLTPQRRPVDVLVVDHIERPTPD